jgi:hypothetical protein
MFVWNQFVAARTRDNPTYERFRTSSLHTLCTLLQGPTPPTAAQVAAAMNNIPRANWQKYTNVKSYLLRAFPDLAPLVRDHLGSINNFRTLQMAPQAKGFILHVVGWSSSTGSLQDLGHIQTREHVSWGRPANAAQRFFSEGRPANPALMYLLPEYQRPGDHFGMGNALTVPASRGSASDVHHPAGPFTPAAFQYNGADTLQFAMDQVYEFSEDDGASWNVIPNSAYRIVRGLSAGPVFTIAKRHRDRQADSARNQVRP